MPTHTHTHIYVMIALTAFLSGCSQRQSANRSSIESTSFDAGGISTTHQADPRAVRLGDEAERHFDFGHVIGDPSQKLSHSFTLRNRTGRLVRIARAVNGMPCCGEVDPIQANEVRPGESLSVTVRIRPQRIGPLRYWAAVITDGPEASEIILDTIAQVHAPLRIEALEGHAPDVAPSHGFTRRFELIECVTISNTMNSQAMAGRSISAPERTAKVQWDGPPRERQLSDQLKERIHPFSVTLTAGEQSGTDQTSLVVYDGTESRLTHQLRWNVVAAIKASPTLLRVGSRSSGSHTLILSSIEGQPFEIVGTTSNLPQIAVSTREEAGGRHVLDVRFKAGASNERARLGEIVFETNLAAQRRVRVPVLVVNETAVNP